MNESPPPLILDLVEWVAEDPKPYEDVMDAWRTSCPRLSVWEDTVDRGLVERRHVPGTGVLVAASPAGRDALRAAGRL